MILDMGSRPSIKFSSNQNLTISASSLNKAKW